MNILYIFIILLCINKIYCGGGWYINDNNLNMLTLNIYNYDNNYKIETLKNNIRIVNELLCTYNSYKFNEINLLENRHFMPFADIIIDSYNQYNLKDFLNSDENLNNIKYHIIINNTEPLYLYNRLVEYLIIKKYDVKKRCTTTHEYCDDKCVGENNLCIFTYPLNLVHKSSSICSRINTINYNIINSKDIRILLYRHVKQPLYNKMIDIMNNIISINNIENYNSIVDLFPYPNFNSYEICENKRRTKKMGFHNKLINLDIENCYIFITKHYHDIFSTFQNYKKYKIDNPTINPQLFLNSEEYLKDYIIKLNGNRVTNNFTYERINIYKYRFIIYKQLKENYLIEQPDISEYGKNDKEEYFGISTEYYFMCSRDDIVELYGQICHINTINNQTNFYNENKLTHPEIYDIFYPSNFDVDYLYNIINASNYGDTVLLILSNNSILINNNMQDIIIMANRKLITIHIILYKSDILSVNLKILTEKTNCIISIINDDHLDYALYISYLTNKQIIKYNEKNQDYNIYINSDIPEQYQLLTLSNIDIYDNYGNVITPYKISYTNALYMFTFTVIPGRTLVRFSAENNKFISLKKYIIDDAYIQINGNLSYIYINRPIQLNYTIYTSDKIEHYYSDIISNYHLLSYNISFKNRKLTINTNDGINMNNLISIQTYIDMPMNIINSDPIPNIISSIIDHSENIISNLGLDDNFEKNTLCDLRYFPYCIVLIIVSIVLTIILIIILIGMDGYIACNVIYYDLLFAGVTLIINIILITFITLLIILTIYFINVVNVSIPRKSFFVDDAIISSISICLLIIILCVYKKCKNKFFIKK
jgi:hypothetical protein